jgi:putative membrane protein
MTSQLLTKFLVRWFVSGLGLWIASGLLGPARMELGVGNTSTLEAVIIAGFFLALVNMVLKPLLIILSFPAIILSLGLFMLVINGFTILVASWLYSPLFVKSLGVSIVAGIILGLVNYLVTRILEDL